MCRRRREPARPDRAPEARAGEGRAAEKLIVVVLVLIGLSGCASGRYWTKVGVSGIELAQDDAACKREASEATPRSVGRGGGRTGKVWVNHWRDTDCMRRKGYEWTSR